MSAFEGFYKKEYINAVIILGANRKVDIKNAFNAGLEAAAKYVDTGGNVFEQLASSIRALKEQT